jgi:hypothetical protein
VIRDDTDTAPSGGQQSADTIDQRIDFRVNLANEQGIERMTQRVELAGFRPAAALAADGHARLIVIENHGAGAGHRIAKPRCRRGLAAGRDDGREVLCISLA